MATNECSTELQLIKHRENDIGIPEAYSCTKIYNDNKAAVQWAASVTSKGIKHLNLRENMFDNAINQKMWTLNTLLALSIQEIFLQRK